MLINFSRKLLKEPCSENKNEIFLISMYQFVTNVFYLQILGLNVIHSQIKEVLKIRRNNPPPEDEKLLVDVALDSDLSEEEITADIVTYIVGGFHTSGLCERKIKPTV